MKKPDIKSRIENDPDFIASKRFKNSVECFTERYPNGAPNRTIASALMITEEELEYQYNEIVIKLRKFLKA